MSNHFAAIGLGVADQDSFRALVSGLLERADVQPVGWRRAAARAHGHRWRPGRDRDMTDSAAAGHWVDGEFLMTGSPWPAPAPGAARKRWWSRRA
ncbi:hypothetical protein ABZ461_17090 [Actinacidiphila glaucinigra]|uniref:hypothetical protein n=1 Tax=Actinacidiphila glaucinigra TaxID=235986 RepID=UPI0033F1E1AA